MDPSPLRQTAARLVEMNPSTAKRLTCNPKSMDWRLGTPSTGFRVSNRRQQEKPLSYVQPSIQNRRDQEDPTFFRRLLHKETKVGLTGFALTGLALTGLEGPPFSLAANLP